MGSLLSLSQLTELKRLNPSRFFVENVRAILGSSSREAKSLCELGVTEGVFTKKIGVVCKNCERIIVSYDTIGDPDKTIVCDLCMINDEDHFDWKLSELNQKDIYGMVT